MEQFKLAYFHQGRFRKVWKIGYFRLHPNNQLEWSNTEESFRVEGCIMLNDIMTLIKLGSYAKVYSMPVLPKIADKKLIACVPRDIFKQDNKNLWLLFNNIEDLE